MERKRTASSVKSLGEQAASETTSEMAEVMSIAQIQGLVRLLDRSDVAELEVKQANEGVHLVLRKVKAPEGSVLAGGEVGELLHVVASNGTALAGEQIASANQQSVAAPLVGVFHPWLKPRGGTLVAVGDYVKAGQLVGTIESLNVLNEVEASVAGRVVEIHVQDGQPVEYGQVLITIEGSEVEEV